MDHHRVSQARARATFLDRQLIVSLFFILASLIAVSASFAQIVGSAQLNVERRGHTATLLQDGKVLIVGGENQGGIVGQAEILDPASLAPCFVRERLG